MLQKSGLFSDSLTVFGKNLTTTGKVDDSINSSKIVNVENCGQKMVGRKGCVTISVLKSGFLSSVH